MKAFNKMRRPKHTRYINIFYYVEHEYRFGTREEINKWRRHRQEINFKKVSIAVISCLDKRLIGYLYYKNSKECKGKNSKML